ncbi:MAG: hypothetical protein AAB671_00770 [Patescibacteria group bacterium]
MLEVAGTRNPVKTNWVNRVCRAVRDNAELRRRFGITNMVAFRTFVRRQTFGAVKSAALVLEAGNIAVLLYRWQREQKRKEQDDGEPAHSASVKASAPPDGQLHLLPFWAGVPGLKL